MKFFALAAVVATAQAAVGATCSAQANPSTCLAGVECCGDATPSKAGSGTAQTICQTKTLTAWEDKDNNVYTFSCTPFKAEGAIKLGMGFAAVVASSFMMA